MTAPTNYKKATHSYEQHGKNNKVAYRNGDPLFMILECPDKGHESDNVVILRKIKHIGIEDIIGAIFGGLK